MGILKEYHFTTSFIGTRHHQTLPASLAFIKYKGVRAAVRARDYKPTPAARADFVFF